MRGRAASSENKTEQACIIETQYGSHFTQSEKSFESNSDEARKLWIFENLDWGFPGVWGPALVSLSILTVPHHLLTAE